MHADTARIKSHGIHQKNVKNRLPFILLFSRVMLGNIQPFPVSPIIFAVDKRANFK